MKAKNIYSIVLIALLCVSAFLPAHAAPGESCSDPITLTQDFSENITGACERWYIANTFDLPLAIKFYPSNPNSKAPNLALDFSCTPGVYGDSILCSLFCTANGASIQMPYEQTPAKDYDDQGKAFYEVEFGEFYRDLLLRQGIDYNVPVYIRVTYYDSGSLKMDPDPFNNCMDGHKFMHLGDTVQVQAQDKERHVIVPYVQWQYDSIRYVWQGTTPCTFAVGNKCGFDPTKSESVVIDKGILQPGGQFKVSSALLMEYVSNQKDFPNDAGMYFAKFYSEEPGIMKIEKIPAPAPGAGATLLKYGVETVVNRKDTTTVYAMPDSWIKAMQFTTPAEHVFKMYIGQTPDFYTTDAVLTYQFDRTEEGHQLSLQASDMQAIWKNKLAGENYLYIRFECADNTTILPTLWTPSPCTEKTTRIEAGKQFEVTAKSSDIYSLYYPDWKGGDMTIAWNSTQAACPFYIADTCEVPNSDIAPVFYTGKAPKKSSTTVPMDTIATWESKVDPDGYIYIRFYSTAKGKITVTTSAPAEEDPECHTVDTVFQVEAWDAYELRGVRYTESGAYKVSTDDTWCPDSVYTFQLTIHTTSYDTIHMTECDSVEHEGKWFYESTEILDTIATDGGDRLIRTTYLTVNHSSFDEEYVLQFEPYIARTGEVYEESVELTDSLQTIAGCDSIIVHHVTIGTVDRDTISLSGCDSVSYDDRTFTQSGMYSDTVKISASHYEVTTYAVEVTYTTSNELVISQEEDYLSPAGSVYTESGDYTDTIPNTAGCDSIITIHLTIYTTSYDTLEPIYGCDRMAFEGKVYTKSCTFTDTIVDASYNVTIRTVTLIIGHTSYAEETVFKNGSYTSPRGNVYTESGDYTENLTNAEGCDSIITLHITIGNASYDTVYFCRGYNREHEEQVNELLFRYYTPYIYESPATFNYKEGMVVETRDGQVLLDIRRAESNLKNHYTEPLMPIESIAWSMRYEGESAYTPIVVADEPQWVRMGILAVQILFHCGEMYSEALPMAIEETVSTQAPVKRIVDGQVLIFRGDAVYTPMGVKVESER